jgi:hypothetical protein
VFLTVLKATGVCGIGACQPRDLWNMASCGGGDPAENLPESFLNF